MQQGRGERRPRLVIGRVGALVLRPRARATAKLAPAKSRGPCAQARTGRGPGPGAPRHGGRRARRRAMVDADVPRSLGRWRQHGDSLLHVASFGTGGCMGSWSRGDVWARVIGIRRLGFGAHRRCANENHVGRHNVWSLVVAIAGCMLCIGRRRLDTRPRLFDIMARASDDRTLVVSQSPIVFCTVQEPNKSLDMCIWDPSDCNTLTGILCGIGRSIL